LRSFQAATIIYDATVRFCERFMDKRSRTVDQMVQAARSGRQNIAEGSRAAATSSQMELKLVNVARASLDELLLDFEDYLRQHGHRQWLKDDPEALAVRAVGRKLSQANQQGDFDPARHWQAYAPWLEHRDPAVVANAVLCLIHQANYLLDQQITALERQFIADGGYTEQLAAMRRAERAKQQGPDPAGPPQPPARDAPHCPKCGQTMVLRTARQGPNAGSQFWGCSGYPNCRGTRKIRAESDQTNSTDSYNPSNPSNQTNPTNHTNRCESP
jgi:four helix bundle suffix protein